jgi:hypothetical protein
MSTQIQTQSWAIHDENNRRLACSARNIGSIPTPETRSLFYNLTTMKKKEPQTILRIQESH